jgi:hypothetical protein
VIIDYDERIFADTPTNGFVARWKGNDKDRGLIVIAEMLEEMLQRERTVNDMLNFYGEEGKEAQETKAKEIQKNSSL